MFSLKRQISDQYQSRQHTNKKMTNAQSHETCTEEEKKKLKNIIEEMKNILDRSLNRWNTEQRENCFSKFKLL